MFSLGLAVVALALAAAVSRADASRAAAQVGRCHTTAVSGGDYNGAGGTVYAVVIVTNRGKGSCEVGGRPWLRLPRLPHAVTVTNLGVASLAGSGLPVALRPGQRAQAFISIAPGSCDRGRSVSFGLRARAGWGGHSVTIRGLLCNNGSGQVGLGSFRRPS